MIDEEKVRKVKLLGLIALGGLLLLIGFGAGVATNSTAGTVKKDAKINQETKNKVLTHDTVEQFLIAYFTKKDLEENRNRYKAFMTESMYNQETSKEDEAVNQTYKGFVVDFIYKSSEIYIDTNNNVAIAKVRYTNTLLAEKDNYDKAQKDVMNEVTIRLSYLNDGGKFKINKLEDAILTLNGENTNYPDYGTLTTSSEAPEE